jgi:uncharacterized protein
MNTIVMKVVIDTNVFITIIGIESPYRWIFDTIIDGAITLCVTTEILLEYHEILTRKTSLGVAENVTKFLSVYPFVEKVEPNFRFKVIESDPDDNKFIDCAIAAQANCIVSNDKHLHDKRLNVFPNVLVVRADGFDTFYKSNLL